MKKFLSYLFVIFIFLNNYAVGEPIVHGYTKGEHYTFIAIGNYPYERDGQEKPVTWRVLSVENNKALLISEYILDVAQVINESDISKIKKRNYRKIDNFNESDLYADISIKYFEQIFANEPTKEALLDYENNEKLFILSSDEMTKSEYGFSTSKGGNNPPRQAECTPFAKYNRRIYVSENGKSPYWTSTIKSPNDYYLQLVGYDGHLSWGGYTRNNVGIRPSILLNLNLLDIISGNGSIQNPFTFRLKNNNSTTYTLQESLKPTINNTILETNSIDPNCTPKVGLYNDNTNTVTLSFVGDCSIGDAVQYTKSPNSFHDIITKNGYDWPFSLVKDVFLNDDLSLANLEVVLTKRTNNNGKVFPLKANPKHVNILKYSGIDLLNTANNHCMDFFESGYKDTLSALDNAKLERFGTVYTDNLEFYDKLYTKTIKNIKFGFIGFSYPAGYDLKKIIKKIELLKFENKCDIVILSLHWGQELQNKPSITQKEFAKTLIDTGADVIYGHGAHVLQPIQLYKGKPIFYSTGNFTFGTMSKVDPDTGIFQLSYIKNNGYAELSKLKVIPCRTQLKPDYRPYIIENPEEQKKLFAKLCINKIDTVFENPVISFKETGEILFKNEIMLH